MEGGRGGEQRKSKGVRGHERGDSCLEGPALCGQAKTAGVKGMVRSIILRPQSLTGSSENSL